MYNPDEEVVTGLDDPKDVRAREQKEAAQHGANLWWRLGQRDHISPRILYLALGGPYFETLAEQVAEEGKTHFDPEVGSPYESFIDCILRHDFPSEELRKYTMSPVLGDTILSTFQNAIKFAPDKSFSVEWLRWAWGRRMSAYDYDPLSYDALEFASYEVALQLRGFGRKPEPIHFVCRTVKTGNPRIVETAMKRFGILPVQFAQHIVSSMCRCVESIHWNPGMMEFLFTFQFRSGPITNNNWMDISLAAARADNVRALSWIRDNHGDWDMGRFNKQLFRAACYNGATTAAQWVHTKYPLDMRDADNVFILTTSPNYNAHPDEIKKRLKSAEWMLRNNIGIKSEPEARDEIEKLRRLLEERASIFR